LFNIRTLKLVHNAASYRHINYLDGGATDGGGGARGRACVRAQSMCRCVESIKCQVCQLTKSNECAKRQRDEICRCNQAYKARVRELEKDLNRANSVIDCLREKVGYYSGRDERRSGRRGIS